MRLDRIRLRGIGPFREEIDLDVDALPGTMVAVTGENGAGKTMLLEAFAGALHRKLPSRGRLHDVAVARDAFIEVEITNGAHYRIRHLVDGVSRKSESLVVNENGSPALDSAKARAYDDWAAAHLPPPEVFLSSVFAPQGAAALVDRTDGERKAIVLRALGIERYEAMAKRAAELARIEEGLLKIAQARIEELKDVDVAAAEQELEQAALADDAQRLTLDEAKRKLEAAQARAIELARAEEERKRLEAQYADRHRELERARLQVTAEEHQVNRAAQEIQDARARQGNNEQLVRDRDRINGALARAEEIARELAELEARHRGLVAERDAATLAKSQHEREAAAAGVRARQAAVQAGRLRESLRQAEQAEQAAQFLDALRAKAAQAREALQAAEQALTELQSRQLAGAAERIDGLRSGLQSVTEAARVAEARTIAKRTLKADDSDVRLAKELPEQLDDARRILATRRDEAVRADRAATECAELAARGERAAADRQALGEAETAQAAEKRAHAQSRESAAAEVTRAAGITGQMVGLSKLGEQLEAENRELIPWIEKAKPLAVVEQRLAQLREQIAAAETRRDEASKRLTQAQDIVLSLEQTLRELPRPSTPVDPPDLEPLRLALAQAESLRLDTTQALANARTRVTATREAAERLETLTAERQGVEAELADWRRLAADLGRGGLQAIEIGNAGPELTTLTNDLLRVSLGYRYSIAVQSTRLDATGKRELEGLPIIVTDTIGGYEGEVRGFSGGQRALINEALSLALTMLVARRSGMREITLIRDEPTAALSPANGRAYVAMMRRAAELVGASKVLFVSHMPELLELADSRVLVQDGGLRVA